MVRIMKGVSQLEWQKFPHHENPERKFCRHPLRRRCAASATSRGGPALLDESRRALDELTRLVELPSVYPFQLDGAPV